MTSHNILNIRQNYLRQKVPEFGFDILGIPRQFSDFFEAQYMEAE